VTPVNLDSPPLILSLLLRCLLFSENEKKVLFYLFYLEQFVGVFFMQDERRAPLDWVLQLFIRPDNNNNIIPYFKLTVGY
jgi:hypothetical protein